MSGRGMHRYVFLALIAACVVVGGIAIARTSYASYDDVAFSQLRWQFVALSALSATAFVCTYGVCWWMLMCALQRQRAPFARTVRLFLLTWPGRYVPGSLPYYGGRLLAGPDLGFSRASVAASLVYENLFVVATSGSLSLMLLLVGFRDHLAGGRWLFLACAAAVASLAALHPFAIRACIRVAPRRMSRLRAIEDHVLSAGAVARLIPMYAAGTLLAGLAFYCALLSVSPGNDVPLLLAIAAYNLGGIAGMLAVPLPSGLGVREGVTVAVLGAVVSPPVALSAAVLARLAAVGADLLPFTAIVVVGFVGGIRPRAARLEPERIR